jgi:hypothetical protein
MNRLAERECSVELTLIAQRAAIAELEGDGETSLRGLGVR